MFASTADLASTEAVQIITCKKFSGVYGREYQNGRRRFRLSPHAPEIRFITSRLRCNIKHSPGVPGPLRKDSFCFRQIHSNLEVPRSRAQPHNLAVLYKNTAKVGRARKRGPLGLICIAQRGERILSINIRCCPEPRPGDRKPRSRRNYRFDRWVVLFIVPRAHYPKLSTVGRGAAAHQGDPACLRRARRPEADLCGTDPRRRSG